MNTQNSLQESERSRLALLSILEDQKLIEESLRKSEERFKQVAENAGEWIWEVDVDGLYTYASPVVERILGFKPEEIVGKKHFNDLFSPDIREELKQAAFGVFAQKETFRNFVNPNIHKSGDIVILETSGTPFVDDKGNLLGYRGVDTDITERKRAEENLRASEAKLRATFAAMQDVIIVYDSEGRYLEIAPTNPSNLYRPPADMLGKTVTEVLPPEQAGYILEQIQRTLEKGEVTSAEYCQRLAENDVWFAALVSPLSANSVVWVAHDITKRKQAEEEIKQRAARLAAINHIARALATTLKLDELLEIVYREVTAVLEADAFFIALYDREADELDFRIQVDKGVREPPTRRPMAPGLTAAVVTSKQPLLIRDFEREKDHLPPTKLWGTMEAPQSWLGVPMLLGQNVVGVISVQAYPANAFGEAEQDLLSTIADAVAVAIENARLYTSLSNEKQRLELLYNLSHHLTESLDSHQVATKALDHICTALGAFKGVIYVPRPQIDRWELLAAVGLKPIAIETFNQNADVPLTSGLIGWAASHKKTAIAPDVAKDKRWLTIPGLDEWVRSAMATPLLAGNIIVGVLNLLSDQIDAFREDDAEIVQAAAASVAVALQNARLYAAEKRRAERLVEISKLGVEIAALHEASTVLNILVTRAAAIMESATCTVMLIDTSTNEAVLAAQTGLPEGASPELRTPLELPLLRHSVESSQPTIIPDINHDAPAMRAVLIRPDIHAFFAYPMMSEGRAIGFITFSKLTPHTPSAEEIAACQLLAERAAVALENVRLFEETTRSLNQVQALRTIDMTIASSFDLRLTLNILLEQTRTQLGVDAVDMLIFSPHTQMLDYAAGIGFRTTALQGTHLRLGQSYAGIASLERETIHVSNLREHKTDFLRSPNFRAEEFDTYFGVPLIAKGQLKGVLEVFQRSPLQPNQNWMDFLETLAKQAAIAIDNASLFSDLQSSNADLILAYNATIEGWSKALDLRDKETEGHTQRVVEATIRLARAMGVIEAELTNVRRGALLHDIGKMGIPDDILHKPGPLSVEEWATMRQHPVHAREMLSSIAYLRPALDIPYNHHEKWDGNGYPNGLKGEQIPLAARIFTVVDVFDALTSDRPYRLAWPREKALDYIREQAGKHFDPKVVEVFLRIVENIQQ